MIVFLCFSLMKKSHPKTECTSTLRRSSQWARMSAEMSRSHRDINKLWKPKIWNNTHERKCFLFTDAEHLLPISSLTPVYPPSLHLSIFRSVTTKRWSASEGLVDLDTIRMLSVSNHDLILIPTLKKKHFNIIHLSHLKKKIKFKVN